MSWTAGLYFASGQFFFVQRLNASSVNDGDGELQGLDVRLLADPLEFGRLDLGDEVDLPELSARSTASCCRS